MSSAVSNVIPNPLSHKHDGSPNSLSTISSSPPGGGSYSPSQALISHPSSGTAAATVNASGYQVYGVSPTEGSTASGICSTNGGPMSNVENTLTGNGESSQKIKDCDFFDEQMLGQPCNSEQQFINPPPVLTIKNPFDDDDEEPKYSSSMQQQPSNSMPPQPPSAPPMQHPLTYDQVVMARRGHYAPPERHMLIRTPYAFNGLKLPYPYPLPEGAHPSMLNRSPAYAPMMPMHPMMRFHIGLMPPHGVIPIPPQQMQPPPNPPPPTKAKSRSRKQNNNQQQQQAASMPPPQIMPPPMGHPQMMRMQTPSMDMLMRPSSSTINDMLMHQRMNGEIRPRLPSGPPQPVGRHRGPKYFENGNCYICQHSFNKDNLGIKCTALNQGCYNYFHPKCENLSDDAFMMLTSNENIEWVCRMCCGSKNLTWSVS